MRINGAKGVALFAFAIMAAAYGIAFLSPWAIIPPPPKGLIFLDSLVPLQVWGGAWWISSAVLLWGAFREDQARAIAPFTAMLFVWAASYGFSAWEEYHRTGYTVFWLAAVLFMAFLAAVLAVARLVNAPPVDIEALRHRLEGDGGQT